MDYVAPWIALALETAGVVAIFVGAVISFIWAGVDWLRQNDESNSFERLRVRLGRSIMLGLELLVAGDIVRTVAVDFSFHSVGILGGIVLIRTFLSFTLEVETRGRWPWQESPGHD